jgi:hypothetical protein
MLETCELNNHYDHFRGRSCYNHILWCDVCKRNLFCVTEEKIPFQFWEVIIVMCDECKEKQFEVVQ